VISESELALLLSARMRPRAVIGLDSGRRRAQAREHTQRIQVRRSSRSAVMSGCSQ
jgi:hypothetical protein